MGRLLQKKIVVKEFVLDHPEIEIHRDRLGIWQFLGHSNQASPFSFLASFFVLGKIEVRNGQITVIDESPSDSVRGVVLEGVTWVSDTSYEDAAVLSTLMLSGNLRQAQGSAPFRLSGTFEANSSVPLSFSDGQKISFEHMMFAGTMEASNLAVNQLAEFVSYGEFFSQFPGRLKIESRFKWVKKEATTELHFSNIALSNPALTLAGNANIQGLKDGNQMTSVSLRSSNLNLEMIRKAIPETWFACSVGESLGTRRMGWRIESVGGTIDEFNPSRCRDISDGNL